MAGPDFGDEILESWIDENGDTHYILRDPISQVVREEVVQNPEDDGQDDREQEDQEEEPEEDQDNQEESKEKDSEGEEEPETEGEEPETGENPEPEGGEPTSPAEGAGEAAENAGELAGEAGAEGAEAATGAAEGAAAAAEAGAAAAEGTAAAVEAGAAAAEGAAVATEATMGLGELIAATSPWSEIIIAVVIIVLVLATVIGIALMTPEEAAGDELGSCLTTVDFGEANGDGYYQLPTSANYTMNGGSPPAQQWGSKDEIQIISDVGQKWATAHPTTKFAAGDLNSSGHHDGGDEFDIYSPVGSPIFMANPGHGSKANYDSALTIELGKMFLDTGAINRIVYNDESVARELRSYISSKQLDAIIVTNASGHDDHFHIRINLGVYDCYAGDGSKVGDWYMPVDTGVGFGIRSPYGMRMHPTKHVMKMHAGVDIGIQGSGDANKPVYAANPGKITELNRKNTGCGTTIAIDHGNGHKTRYVHLLKEGSPNLSVGGSVTGGQKIGKIGPYITNCSTGAHLHFELYKNGSTVDPEKYMDFSKL